MKSKLEEIRGYADSSRVPPPSLVLMAKLALVISEWMDEYGLQATAVQCWNSLQANYGVNACTIMSMMSERLRPSACEVDIAGVVAMYALQLASGQPSALVDWNNNYAGNPISASCFTAATGPAASCPPPKSPRHPFLAPRSARIAPYGALSGRTPAGPLTFARVSTDDCAGRVRTYVGEGAFTDDPLSTFGSRAVVEVPHLQRLMRHICRNGFEHHAAMNASHCAGILAEAFSTYLGWDVYHHNAPDAD